ncbi:hypothetical protein FI667_g3533, partial [Globisporangium splendens]
MGLDELQPGNTKRAKATAVKAFGRFLDAEEVSLEYVKICIERDVKGQTFVSVMDKFGMYLAFNEGKNGKPLARHSAMQYYRQVKIWLLEQFPQHRASLETRLLKMGRTLENFCVKREGGGFVKKATACTKVDLSKMIFAVSSMVPLRRASDLTLVRKQNVSIDAGNVFFLRFIRMKTSEEQGLSIHPCNVLRHVSIARDRNGAYDQAAPCSDLLDNLPEQPAQAALSLGPTTPLLEILDNGDSYTELQPPNTDAADITPTIPVTAQHANGSADLTVCWIFDRGAWNMSTTNKGFSYVFNTTKEDHKVSKVLSGWHVDDSISLLDLTRFDTQTQDRIKNVQNRLYTTCKGLGTTRFNVNQRVLDVLTAYLIRHYPLLKEVNPEGPVIKRLETCVLESDCTVADLLSWSTHLVAIPSSCTKEEIKPCKSSKQVLKITEESSIIRHQASVIDHFIQHVKRQDARMDALEAKLNGAHSPSKEKRQQEDPVASEPKKRKTHQAVTHLKTTWFSWYAHEPRMWSAQGDKQKKSDAKLLVAFMKLFLEDGFALDSQAPNYRDLVLELGSKAESSVLEFLRARGISSKGSNAVLKHLRVLHRSGALNDKIAHHRKLLAARKILDPAPGFTQDVLELVVFSKQSDS